MKFLIFAFLGVAFSIAALSASASTSNDSDDIDKLWEDYKKTHRKTYPDPKEEELRKEIFARHQAHVNNHNKKYANGEVPYSIGFTEFSDMTQSEKNKRFGARFNHTKIALARRKRLIGSQNYILSNNGPIFHIFSADSTFKYPASVDWRTTGWNESVRNQGSCGSCWAFSTSTMNSFYQFNKTKSNIVLSPQNLVDCATVWGAGECNGADPGEALEYMEQQKQVLESAYPYKGVNGTCKVPSTATLYGINGFVYINNDMNSLKQAVAQLGVIVISINANNIMNYKSGIFDGYDYTATSPTLCSSKPNHAVALIGYGTDAATNKTYWLIKNSWGTTWGEKGYIRMAMTSNSLCGIYSFNYGMV